MKPSKPMQITAVALFMAVATFTVHAAKGGHQGGGTGPGPNDPVFTLESTDPYIPPVDSHSVDPGGQVVFYGSMDLSDFPGMWSNGTPCNEGFKDGTIVIAPKSSTNPLTAELTFWFSSSLESGDSVTYMFTMEGQFDEPDNWLPTAADPSTTVTFNSWDLQAENKKARRLDCAGTSDFPAGPWHLTVTLKSP